MSLEVEMRRLNLALRDDLNSQLKKRSRQMLNELAEATPKDTGRASRSWSVKVVSQDVVKLENSVDYIEHLNEGSSIQAPAHFVERIALKYGKPVGIIVEVK